MAIYTVLIGFLAVLGVGTYLLASTLGRPSATPPANASRCPTCDRPLPRSENDET